MLVMRAAVADENDLPGEALVRVRCAGICAESGRSGSERVHGPVDHDLDAG